MTTASYAVTDSFTMLRRNLRRMRRYPMVFYIAGIPLVLLFLFVYVLGGTLGAGLGQSGTREDYIAYVMPGILLITVAGSATGTAVAVAMDITEGIISRFRTMAISRAAVLSGHVIANVLQTMLAVVIVVAIALVIGFRPTTGVVEWIAAAGLLALITFAITWLSVALGLVSKSVESASNLPMPLTFLPFFGSGFVPTDSMPDPLRVFADNQPFTPMIETLRGLLFGTPIGDRWVLAIAWCVVISVVGYLWSMRLYNRDPKPAAT
jgi:ABC-2 type transport system permease protein